MVNTAGLLILISLDARGIGGLWHCVLMQDYIQEEVVEREEGCGEGKNFWSIYRYSWIYQAGRKCKMQAWMCPWELLFIACMLTGLWVKWQQALSKRDWDPALSEICAPLPLCLNLYNALNSIDWLNFFWIYVFVLRFIRDRFINMLFSDVIR